VLKRRLIFALLWQKDAFWLSRNFRIQRAGDLAWIEKHYNFQVIADAIDELMILNVSREGRNIDRFANQISELTRGCFVPLAAGGGVRSVEDARLLLRSGADKICVNAPLFDDPQLVRSLAREFGRQCVVASVDYVRRGETTEVMTANGTRGTGLTVREAILRAMEHGAGEVLLTSIEKDGTGFGYDLPVLKEVAAWSSIPVIACGGVGSYQHLSDWLSEPSGLAACTANIFNFLGGGLLEARNHLKSTGVQLASWEVGWRG
jgi:cyclase